MSATMPCATAQPWWLTEQAIEHYRLSRAHYKSVNTRTANRRKFITYAKQAIPVIGGAAFLEEFSRHVQAGDKEGVAVVEELIREMAAGK
jgi:hypothetical protein